MKSTGAMKTSTAQLSASTVPGVVALTAIPGLHVALCGVKQTVRALVQIKTPPPREDHPRPRLHVAVVLDKSGYASYYILCCMFFVLRYTLFAAIPFFV